jgi:hypothetical protein
MTTLYPNIIYHPDTETEIFIDTLQAIDNIANADVVTYQSAIDGSLGTFNRGIGARQLTLNGKISEDNENELRRQLQYLRGKQVYLMLGARNIATLARIKTFDMPIKVGTYTALTLDVECETETEGQYWEGNDDYDVAVNSAEYSDSDATNGTTMRLYQDNSSLRYVLTQSDIVMPQGDYKMFARVKDQNHVTDDILLKIYNYTDSVDIASDNFTSALDDMFAPIYSICMLDFTIDSADVGDTIRFYIEKDTITTNEIYVDYLGFVRID